MKRLLLTTAVASLLSGAAWAESMEMSDFDDDGDQLVSRAELEDGASGVTDEIWSMYDTDESDDLDGEEFEKVVFSDGDDEDGETEEVSEEAEEGDGEAESGDDESDDSADVNGFDDVSEDGDADEGESEDDAEASDDDSGESSSDDGESESGEGETETDGSGDSD